MIQTNWSRPEELRPGSGAWLDHYGLSSRQVCRMAQLELAYEDERLYSLEGDLGMPSVPFHEVFPKRWVQLGISEADLVGCAAGMSKRGKVPFVNSFASFLIMRACEQVRLAIAYHNSNVKLIGYYSGTSGGLAASTHYCIEDYAITRALPNFVVLSPADSIETYKATRAAFEHDGPVYIRVGRAETPQVYQDDYDFQIGKAVQLSDGDDIAIFATGNLMVAEAQAAVEQLRADGIGARLVNVHTLKPLDGEAIAEAAAACGAAVTVEDHNIYAGLGCAVAEVLMQHAPVPLARVGLDNAFPEKFGPQEEMLPWYGMDAASIAATAKQVLERKSA